MRRLISIEASIAAILFASSLSCLLAELPHVAAGLPFSVPEDEPAPVRVAAGRRTLSETLHGFCSSCDRPDKTHVPPCECYAYCCIHGYTYNEPSTVCEEVLDSDGENTCADPCVSCSTVSNPSIKEACFQGCCKTDFFADSCKAWRLSAMDVYVSGTKIITDAESGRLQGRQRMIIASTL